MRLTTVEQPTAEIARLAVDAALGGKPVEGRRILQASLSCRKPPPHPARAFANPTIRPRFRIAPHPSFQSATTTSSVACAKNACRESGGLASLTRWENSLGVPIVATALL